MTDEQITFAGIPIPLTIPTILDAMVATACGNMNWKQARRIRAKRQYRAFRARILRMDAEKDARIRQLEDKVFYLKREQSETNYWMNKTKARKELQ